MHVVRNGIDTMQFRPEPATELVEAYGIDLSRPYVLFVGRITRQKGIAHLLRAAARFEAGVQLVLCASAPDTPEIGAETAGLVRELQDSRGDVVWIQEHASREALLAAADARAGVPVPVRVRAARHRQPRGDGLRDGGRRVAMSAASRRSSSTGETGLLVPFDEAEPRAFEFAFADAVNTLVADPHRATALGARGRARAVGHFGWDRVAERTLAVYESAILARSAS